MSDSNKLSGATTNLASKVTENSYVKSLLSMDMQWVDRVISVVLLLLVVLLLWETRQYDWAAQRAPVFVFGLLLILLTIELLFEFEIIGSRDYEERQQELKDEIKEHSDVEEQPLLAHRVEIIKTIVWIGVLFSLDYVLGLLPGSLVFLLAFYGTETRVGLLRTMAYSGAIIFFVWVVFEVLLKARLYPGIFEIGEYFYVSGSLF